MSQLFILIYLFFQVMLYKESISTAMELSDDDFRTSSAEYYGITDETTKSEVEFKTEITTDDSTDARIKISVTENYTTESEVKFDSYSTTNYSSESTFEFSTESSTSYFSEMSTFESTEISKETMTDDLTGEDITLSYTATPYSKRKYDSITYLNTTKDVFTTPYDSLEELDIRSTLKSTTEDLCRDEKIILQFKASKVEIDKIVLNWNVNKLYCFRNTSYRLKWKNKYDKKTEVLSSITKKYTLNNLYPCTSYNITLELLSNDTIISQKSLTPTTKKKEEAITAIMFNPNSGSDFIEVVWNTSPLFCINYTYNLIWANKETTKSTILGSEINLFNITDLTACSAYNITLQIINEVKNIINETVMVAETTKIDEKIALQLKASNVENNFILLEWDVNKLYCIQNISYRLIWQHERDKNVIFLPNITKQYTLNNLYPCTSYNITLELLSNNDIISGKSIKPTTKKKDESITVTMFNSNSGSNFMEVQWSTSTIFCTKYTYNLTWTNREASKNKILGSDINFLNITDLTACSVYNITLQIINEEKKIIGETVIVTETKKNDEKIALQLKASNVENNFILLEWDVNKLYCIENISYRLIWQQHERDKNETFLSNITKQYTINNLYPCTSYNITLELLSNNDIISEKSIRPTTKKKDETITVNMINSNSGSNFIEVEWNTSMIFCTNYTYNLIWSNKETTKNTTLGSEISNYNITALEACSTYNIILQIINEVNDIINETVIVAETGISVPGPVYYKKHEIRSKVLHIKWQQPLTASNCVSYYELSITRIDSDIFCNNTKSKKTDCVNVILSNNTKEYSVQNLTSCTKYNISIRSFTSDNRNGNFFSMEVETLIEDVSSVQNLSIYPGTENLTVTWEPPDTSFCVDHYVIFYNSSKEITKETTIILTGLESCSVYNVSVVAVSKNNNSSLPESVFAETTEIALKEVEEFQLKGLDMSIGAKWKPPKKGSACVKEYRVLSWDKNIRGFSVITNRTEIIIPNLIPCGSYEVMIIAISKTNKEGIPTIKSEMVLPKELDPPLYNNEKHVGKHWIQTSWTLTGLDKNKCTTTEAFAQCEEKNPSSLNWTIPYSNVTIKLSGETNIRINVTNLSPYTLYDCSAAVINTKGMSLFSEKITIITQADVPSAPIFISSISQSENSFNIIWQAPVYIPGLLQSFHLHIKSIQYLYPIPSDCPPFEQIQDIVTVDGNKNSYQYMNATPLTAYTIKIAASTQVGQGNFSNPENTVTLPGISGPVRINNEIIHNSHKEEYEIKVIITWNNPCRSNGIIKSFHLIIDYFKFGTITIKDDKILGPNIFNYTIYDLLPETTYTVYISANIENVTQKGEQGRLIFKTPAGIPPLKNIPNVVVPDPFGTDDPTTKTKIVLRKNYFDPSMGQLLYYSLIVSQKNYEDELSWGYLKSNLEWPDIPAWKNDGEFVEPYQATPIRWQPFEKYNKISYILGNESCVNTVQNKTYCNGPLRSNTKYIVTVRTYTENGFRDVLALAFETDQPLNQGMIVGIICAVLLMATVIIIGLFIRSDNNRWNVISCVENAELNNNEPPVPQPIPVKKFFAYAKKLLDEDLEKLSAEFQLIQKISANLALPTTTADLPHNRIKNRYANIKPFDETRVKLLSADDEFSDYINASFIRGYSNTVEYIAAQGPKQETTNDFWEMIYENNVTQVIMLTNFEERGKNKCYPYFPTKSKTMELESVSIRCTLEIDFITYISRTIQIYKNEQKKEIIHLHYTKWPDFGVPNSTEVMIQFCNLIRKQYFSNPGLMVIHCSAGVGRTGTLITLDILMQTVKSNRKLDVFGTVLNLRKQRVLMVQTEDQYEYIYNCIKDFISNPQEGDESTNSTSPIYENLSEVYIHKSHENTKESISESIM